MLASLCGLKILLHLLKDIALRSRFRLLRPEDAIPGALCYRLTESLDWSTQVHCIQIAYFAPISTTLYSKVQYTNYKLSRFLSHIIRTRILNPALLPVALRTVRATLFPNNALGPPRQIPTEDEAKEIKRRCAASLLKLLPPKVAVAFLASNNHVAQQQQVEEILDCLEDTYLNKHLIFQIIELLVLRLAPELEQQGVRDLMEERIG